MYQQQRVWPTALFVQYSQSWIYFLFFSSFLFTSCARYYYAPNSTNIPLLSEKEAKINVQYAAGTVSKGLECQSAFAISPHFGGMINAMIGGSKEDEYISNVGNTKTNFIEVGTGYFTPINATALIFETYGGIGTGGINNKYYNGGLSKVNFTKFFVQPNFGVKVKGFEFGISSRISWIKQRVVSSRYISTDEAHYQNLENISKRPESFLWEPGMVLRFGGQKFLVQMQYTHSVNLTNPDFQFLQEQSYWTIGFSIPIKYTTALPASLSKV